MKAVSMQRTSRSSEDGFTLIEALIAVSLLSLLSVLVAGVLRFGISAWQGNQTIAQHIDEIQYAQNFLRRALTNAHPYFVVVPGGKGYVEFNGATRSMAWLSDPPASLDRAGRLWLKIELEPQVQGSDLVVSTRTELAATTSTPANTVRSLISELDSADFSYFGLKQQNERARWHKEWTKQTSLPELIRIELKSADGRDWAPIFIRPRINIDISCLYDMLTGRCRGR